MAFTCDGDLGRPLGGPVQDALFDGLHLLGVDGFADDKHFPDEFEDFRLVPLPDLHPVLHGHDDILGLVLSSVLGALLSGTCTSKNKNPLLDFCELMSISSTFGALLTL